MIVWKREHSWYIFIQPLVPKKITLKESVMFAISQSSCELTINNLVVSSVLFCFVSRQWGQFLSFRSEADSQFP